MQFRKYQGAGNDFVLLDARDDLVVPADEALPEFAIRVCDRRLGVGGDGVLLVTAPPDDAPEAAAMMRTINSDGSEAEMCGNGLRCVAKYLLEAGGARIDGDAVAVQTLAGLRRCRGHRDDGAEIGRVTLSMGLPILTRADIPVAGSGSTVAEEIPHPDGRVFRFTGVSMGNPHAILFFDDPDQDVVALAKRFGPGLEHHERFPRRCNISFVGPATPEADGGVCYRAAVWERGAGLTAACGTGACAIGVAACVEGRAKPGQTLGIELPGGRLDVVVDVEIAADAPPPAWRWGEVSLTGPARFVYAGEFDPARLPSAAESARLTAATR